MKKLLLFILPVLLIYTGCTFIKAENSQGGNMVQYADKKILIAYFSWGGNTKSIAEKIHNTIGGDMFRIETAVPYPTDYNKTAYGFAKKQHEEGTKPKLKSNGDVSSYDMIFVGTPAWWYEMAPAVKTFISENNFEGKTIVPFITHGGGGKYTIAEDMGKLAKGSKVLEPLVIYENGGANAQQEVDNWLKKIK